ncbi:hypothetical protein BGX33_003164, partial [Mortierella sp. NVP41]
TVVRLSGIMTMLISAMGSKISLYFNMEVRDGALVSEPAPIVREIPKNVFPSVKVFQKGGIRPQLDKAYGKKHNNRDPPSPPALPSAKRHHTHHSEAEDLTSDSEDHGHNTPPLPTIDRLAHDLERSLSTTERSGGPGKRTFSLSGEQLASLQAESWKPAEKGAITSSSSPWAAASREQQKSATSTTLVPPIESIAKAVDNLIPTSVPGRFPSKMTPATVPSSAPKDDDDDDLFSPPRSDNRNIFGDLVLQEAQSITSDSSRGSSIRRSPRQVAPSTVVKPPSTPTPAKRTSKGKTTTAKQRGS